MSALARLVVRFLPPALASQVVACHRKGDKVVVFAATPAAAAKVKMTSESLCKFLLQNGLEVNSVSAKVQPAPPERGIAAPQKRAALSPASVSSLQDLYRKLPESPARRALKALLDHQLGEIACARDIGTRQPRRIREAGTGHAQFVGFGVQIGRAHV